jgi:hypothetical protein
VLPFFTGVGVVLVGLGNLVISVWVIVRLESQLARLVEPEREIYHRTTGHSPGDEKRRQLTETGFTAELIEQTFAVSLPPDFNEIVRVDARESDGRWHLWPAWELMDRKLLITSDRMVLGPDDASAEVEAAIRELLAKYTDGLNRMSAKEFRIVYR